MQSKIYIDTNIFIDLLIDEEKLDDYKKVRSDKEAIKATKMQIYKYIEENKVLVINTSSLTNASFLLTDKGNLSKNQLAIEFLKIENEEMFEVIQESKKLRIETNKFCVENGTDYEDTLQYFCAKNSKCELIISNDKDFPKLNLPIKRTSLDLKDYIPN